MTLPRVLRGALVGAVVACAVLSGCTSDDPAPDPTTTPAATEAPTADATTEPAEILPPERPTLMDSNDAIGARAAAEYFIELRTYSVVSQDLVEFQQRSAADCVFCNNTIGLIESDVSAGYSTTGGVSKFEIDEVSQLESSVSAYQVHGSLTQESTRTVDASGILIEEIDARAAVPFVVFVRFDAELGWLFLDADLA